MRRHITDLRIEWLISAERVLLLLLKAISVDIKAGFREDQPRDTAGRWTDGSSGLMVTGRAVTGKPEIDSTTDLLMDTLSKVHSLVGPGSGPAYGVQVHTVSAEILRKMNIPGIGSDGIEQSFSFGDTVRYGLDGSVRTDVVLRDGQGPGASIVAVWDIKTGSARLSKARAAEIRASLMIGDDIPIIEIHVRRGVRIKSQICRY